MQKQLMKNALSWIEHQNSAEKSIITTWPLVLKDNRIIGAFWKIRFFLGNIERKGLDGKVYHRAFPEGF